MEEPRHPVVGLTARWVRLPPAVEEIWKEEGGGVARDDVERGPNVATTANSVASSSSFWPVLRRTVQIICHFPARFCWLCYICHCIMFSECIFDALVCVGEKAGECNFSIGSYVRSSPLLMLAHAMSILLSASLGHALTILTTAQVLANLPGSRQDLTALGLSIVQTRQAMVGRMAFYWLLAKMVGSTVGERLAPYVTKSGQLVELATNLLGQFLIVWVNLTWVLENKRSIGQAMWRVQGLVRKSEKGIAETWLFYGVVWVVAGFSQGLTILVFCILPAFVHVHFTVLYLHLRIQYEGLNRTTLLEDLFVSNAGLASDPDTANPEAVVVQRRSPQQNTMFSSIVNPVFPSTAPPSREQSSGPQSSGPVFISHTGRDEAASVFAAHLMDQLVSEGIESFYDASIPLGEQWKSFIHDNAVGCSVFVAVLSPTYFQRYWCMHELDLAISYRRRIIPVCYSIDEPESLPMDKATFVEQFQSRISPAEIERWWLNIGKLQDYQHIRRSVYSTKDGDVLLKKEVVENIQGYLESNGVDVAHTV